MSLNDLPIAVPSEVAPAMIATAIKPAIRPYSSAVTARRSALNRSQILRHSIILSPFVAHAPATEMLVQPRCCRLSASEPAHGGLNAITPGVGKRTIKRYGPTTMAFWTKTPEVDSAGQITLPAPGVTAALLWLPGRAPEPPCYQTSASMRCRAESGA